MVTQREKLAVSTKQYFLFLSSISGNIALVRKLFFFDSGFFWQCYCFRLPRGRRLFCKDGDFTVQQRKN